MKLRKEKKRPYRTDHTLPSVPLYPSQQVLVIQVDFRYFLLQVLIKIILEIYRIYDQISATPNDLK